MLNKLLVFIVFFLFNSILNAQFITLEKQNSLDKIAIKMSKKLIFKHQTDSGIIKIKGKVLSYQFPYITFLKNKKDTLTLNVMSVTSLKVSTPIKNTALVFSTYFTTSMFIAGIRELNRGNSGFLALTLIGGCLSYMSITNFGTKYNTKTKWSFY